VNEQIRVREVRLIGPDGAQLGILSINEALRRAEELNLDLVEVSSASRPPVCRLMNFGKFKFEKAKKDREARKNQKGDIKEIKISRSAIAEHDLQVKINHLVSFLEHGDKAKVIVEFRGREQMHRNKGFDILNNLAERLAETAVVERKPILEGRRIIMILAPKKVEKPPERREPSGEKGKDLQDSSQAV
jgi:translation initiation factor IF-3